MHRFLLPALALLSALAPRAGAFVQAAPAVFGPAEGPAIGEFFHPGEEAAWVFESQGVRIGHHASRYLGRDALAGRPAHHFQGSFRLRAPNLGDIDVLSTGDLWTDDHGHPVRFVQQALVGDGYSRVELEVAGPKSRALIVQGPSQREVALDIDPEAFLLANNFVSHLEVLLALLPPAQDAKARIFSGNTLQGLGYALTWTGAFEDDVGGRHVTGDGYDDSLGEHLRFADGRLLDVSIAAAQLLIRRTDEHLQPVTIVPPEVRRGTADFDAEEVRITHGDATIAGTVTRPKGVKGRLPAVFFISGSGPEDRNGFSSGIDLGTHEILDHLTSRGFLVLRVDDRGSGESSALPPDASFLDLVADARACVEHLLARDDVDPRRLVLIGHSEGGETAPILAVEHPEIAAIVLLAAPGRSVIEVIADQNRRALEQAGLGKDEVERQMADVRAFLVRLAGDEELEPAAMASDEERAALANRAWFRSHAHHDPLQTIRKVRCPVLLLQGGKDFQVSPEKDAGALDRALTEAGHADHELHLFAGLDHLFKRTPGETSELADYWKSRPVDAEMLAVLDTWLRKRLQPEGR